MADMMKDGKKLTTTGKYMQTLQKKTPVQLAYIASDAKLAIDAMPDGQNVKYYRQEMTLALAELTCR